MHRFATLRASKATVVFADESVLGIPKSVFAIVLFAPRPHPILSPEEARSCSLCGISSESTSCWVSAAILLRTECLEIFRCRAALSYQTLVRNFRASTRGCTCF